MPTSYSGDQCVTIGGPNYSLHRHSADNSALAAVLRATTPEVLHAVGAYEAVVIGAGAAGGLAALLLAEAGLRVLVLEAGSARTPVDSPPPAAGQGSDSRRQPIQSRCYAWRFAPTAFVDDIDCPYSTPADRPFLWLRARQLGGRLAVPKHGLQYYRLGPGDLAPVDGLSPAWPLRTAELDPWYALVERRLGLAGRHDKVPWLPDSELFRVLKPTPDEAAFQCAISAEWPGTRPILVPGITAG